MKNKIIKLLTMVCIGLYLLAVTSCDTSIGSEPFLKITVDKGTVAFLPAGTNYYIVYENGVIKKTDKFEPFNVICYDFLKNEYDEVSKVLYGTDINTQEGEELNKIANNILLLMGETKLKIISVNRLFVLGEQYYFTLLSDNGKNANSSKLFEYNCANHSVEEILSLDSGDINHVELYQPQ